MLERPCLTKILCSKALSEQKYHTYSSVNIRCLALVVFIRGELVSKTMNSHKLSNINCIPQSTAISTLSSMPNTPKRSRRLNSGRDVKRVRNRRMCRREEVGGGGVESQPTTTTKTTTTTNTTNVAIAWCKEDLTIANDQLKAAREEFDRDYNNLVETLRRDEKALDNRLEKLTKKMEDAAKVYGNMNASGNDFLEINAGGKIIIVKRSILTNHTIGTSFGALFSGRWDKKLQRDRHGRIFLDVNSKCFQAIVAYFNELALSPEDNPPDPPSVDSEYEQILEQQIDLFGLWESVGMTATERMHSNDYPLQESTEGFSEGINDAFDEKRRCVPIVMQKICSLEESFEKEESFIDKFASGDVKDVITLNVSGTLMATKRSTLLYFDESVLAQQFDDSKWTEQGYASNMRVKNWSADEVCEWATNIEGIQEDVGNIFKKNGITGCELLVLNIDGMKLLGIERVGTLCLLQKEIDALVQASQDIVSLIDHCPYCFGKILDFLRLKQQYDQELSQAEEPAAPEVRNSKYKTFEKVVNFYFPGDAAWLILDE